MSEPEVLFKVDPKRNMARFYRVDVWPTLFGEWTVRREWGRIGGGSRVLMRTVGSEEEAQQLAEAKATEKQRRGYSHASAAGSHPSACPHI